MAEIKSLQEIASKWSRVTPQRTKDFELGVQKPKRDWATETVAAEARYADGVQSAINEGRFGKGVSNAGSNKWSRKVVDIGTKRWGAGVQAAAQDMQKGFAAYHDVIQSTSLPPRFPAGDPRNFDRVAAIANALHQRKIGG
jgi:hypothetical protein